MWEDRFFKFVLPCLIVALLLVAVGASISEAEKWERFAAEHDCKLVRVVSGSVSYGTVTINGKTGSADSYTPERKTYRCNDGVEYTR